MSRTDSAANDLVIHIDGASRGNPGPASVGVEICDKKGSVLRTVSAVIGPTTNNIAEYMAYIAALEEAAILGAARLEIYTDSQLLARQLSGEYRVKDPFIKVLFHHARRLAAHFSACTVRHIPREKNQNADRLANEALDKVI